MTPSLKLTAKSTGKDDLAPKRKGSFSASINFQVRTLGFREGISAFFFFLLSSSAFFSRREADLCSHRWIPDRALPMDLEPRFSCRCFLRFYQWNSFKKNSGFKAFLLKVMQLNHLRRWRCDRVENSGQASEIFLRNPLGFPEMEVIYACELFA